MGWVCWGLPCLHPLPAVAGGLLRGCRDWPEQPRPLPLALCPGSPLPSSLPGLWSLPAECRSPSGEGPWAPAPWPLEAPASLKRSCCPRCGEVVLACVPSPGLHGDARPCGPGTGEDGRRLPLRSAEPLVSRRPWRASCAWIRQRGREVCAAPGPAETPLHPRPLLWSVPRSLHHSSGGTFGSSGGAEEAQGSDENSHLSWPGNADPCSQTGPCLYHQPSV